MSDAAESAKISNVLLNVSEFSSIDEATDSLVSMSQAYKDLDKIDIVDKLNNIGNNYSISTDGIATALKDSASSLVTANNDMDEAVALITAGNAVTQDPSKVGAGESYARTHSNMWVLNQLVAVSVNVQRWIRPRKDCNICIL